MGLLGACDLRRIGGALPTQYVLALDQKLLREYRSRRLSRSCARECVNEEDPAGNLERGQTCGQESAEFQFRGSGTTAEDYGGGQILSQRRGCHGECRRFRDRRMVCGPQNIL